MKSSLNVPFGAIYTFLTFNYAPTNNLIGFDFHIEGFVRNPHFFFFVLIKTSTRKTLVSHRAIRFGHNFYFLLEKGKISTGPIRFRFYKYTAENHSKTN